MGEKVGSRNGVEDRGRRRQEGGRDGVRELVCEEEGEGGKRNLLGGNDGKKGESRGEGREAGKR